MKGFISVFLSIFGLLTSGVVQSQIQKIYLNPKTVNVQKQSQFVDSIKFIPLEVREDIKLGSINNMEMSGEFFIIKDYLTKVILLYSKSGKFFKKISYKKFGNLYPGYVKKNNQIVFFGNNKNYALTPNDQIKIKLNWNNPRNRKYFKKYVIDLNDPSFTIRKSIPDQNDISNAYYLFEDYYLHGEISTSPLYKSSLDYEIKLYKDTQLLKSFFPYNRIEEPKFLNTLVSISYSPTDTPYVNFIMRPYCDTVYKMIRDSLFPAYKLVVPLENSLPSAFFTQPFKNKTERDNFNRNNGWMLNQVFRFYETPGLIFFNVFYLSNYDSYIYEKQSKITYKTKNIRADSSQFNLQLLADRNIRRNGAWFYKIQKMGQLLTFFKQNKDTPIPKELQSFMENNPPAETPVIVAFKLKS